MLYAQLTHSIGLNDVVDELRLHSGPLSAVRGATPPSRNGLSHAGKERKAVLAEKLFWAVLGHLQALSPGFARGRRGRGVTHVSARRSTLWIPRPLSWLLRAWTGPNIAAARPQPSAT